MNTPETLDGQAVRSTPLLGPKHQGMRVSAEGVLGRIRDGRDVEGHRFMASEMLRHLEELATRYYAGDALVVDEFLQLYCLDATRPNSVICVK
jgi:hypothetical protein